MMSDDFVYSRIGMALISAQRVEFVTGELVRHLMEFDKQVYNIASKEFFESSAKSKKARMMLGEIFKLLKLNPLFVIEEELDEYLKKRNCLVHHFWKDYLNERTEGQAKVAVDFCNEFGRQSTNLERFFKGFIYFISMRHVKERSELDLELRKWDNELEFFIEALKNRSRLL